MLKLPLDMDPSEQAAAASAAANWREEQERQQRLLSDLASRAEAAELSLAELRLGEDGAVEGNPTGGGAVPGPSSGKIKNLAGEYVICGSAWLD